MAQLYHFVSYVNHLSCVDRIFFDKGGKNPVLENTCVCERGLNAKARLQIILYCP